jgi:hypothetical protein
MLLLLHINSSTDTDRRVDFVRTVRDDVRQRRFHVLTVRSEPEHAFSPTITYITQVSFVKHGNRLFQILFQIPTTVSFKPVLLFVTIRAQNVALRYLSKNTNRAPASQFFYLTNFIVPTTMMKI